MRPRRALLSDGWRENDFPHLTSNCLTATSAGLTQQSRRTRKLPSQPPPAFWARLSKSKPDNCSLERAFGTNSEAMPFQTRLLAEISAAPNKRAARRILEEPQAQAANRAGGATVLHTREKMEAFK